VEVTGNPIGGTVNACRLSADTGQYDDCDVVAAGVAAPLATALDAGGHVHHLRHALEPGAAEVVLVK
jgi:hypothetical protein